MNLFDSLHVQSFGSSSAGNCTCIWDSETTVLVDCGFSPRFITKNLQRLRKNLPEVTAVLLTHTHSDHVNPVMVETLLKYKIPIHCHERLRGPLFRRFSHFLSDEKRKLFRGFTAPDFTIHTLNVRGFEVPHDSEGGCFGFSLHHTLGNEKKKITIATDMGYPKNGIADEFKDSDIIVIESNHDIGLLDGSNRPAYLKERIKKIGHLSNDQSAAFVVEVIKQSAHEPEAVLLAHISQQCNTNTHAERCMKDALQRNKITRTKVVCTHKDQPSELLSI